MNEVILITGASSGFGALTARALARAGHTVYASMLDVSGKNAAAAEELRHFAQEHGVDAMPLEMDVTDQDSISQAIATVAGEHGHIDVLVHNAGHMAFGPAEAFTPEQFAELYDINVVGTQRVNRAVLPLMRKQRRGLLVWVGSTSTRGGTPPLLAPYFAAKAAMDSVAVSYAAELALWGIESSIVVPGAFTSGTNHFANAGHPADADISAAYEAGPYAGIAKQVMDGQQAVVPPDADVAEVAKAIVRIVAATPGKRPFRVYVDPAQDGAEVVGAVADRVRAELLRRIGLEQLLMASTEV